MNNRRKKYYNYRHNRNKKFRYYCHHNKPFFYHKKRKKLEIGNDQNILLVDNSNEDIEENIKEDIKVEQVSEIEDNKKELEFSSNKEEGIVLPKLPIIKMALGIVVVVAIIFGISYGYFYYYQEDSRQADITTAELYVRVVENTVNLSLDKSYPRTDEEARARTDNYVDFTVKAKNPSPTKLLYYTINAANGTDIENKERISNEYIKVDLMMKVNGSYTYILEGVSPDEFEYEAAVPVNTTNELTREYRIRMWISDEVTISDTDHTATFTQSEFHNLYANFHFDVSAQDKILICKRATTLHTEKCTNSDTAAFCQGDGYALNANITYGQLGASGQTPQTGDAFDCNIDGTGYNQRFYYVSSYYDTDQQSFNSNIAVLIYYTNTYSTDGVVAASTQAVAYDASNENWHGPRTAVMYLPSSSQWSNVELHKQKRAMLGEYQSTHNSLTTGNGGNLLKSNFSYNGRAARLLTAQELMQGCGLTQTESGTNGELSTNCKFLFEGTKYADASKETYGPWLETPCSDSNASVLFINSGYRKVDRNSANYTTGQGVRPVIEVPLLKMSY